MSTEFLKNIFFTYHTIPSVTFIKFNWLITADVKRRIKKKHIYTEIKEM